MHSTAGGRLESVAEMQEWVDKINNSRWMDSFLARQGDYRREIKVTDGRRRTSATDIRWAWSGELRMPKSLRSKLVILHELAHVLTPNELPWHGREFCATYLELVKRWLGREIWLELKTSMIEHGMKFRRAS